jgi:BirA family transcriptional regulator, biotin operon repressor / biotin---[acetyl-CoA-carboxylase] ligase
VDRSAELPADLSAIAGMLALRGGAYGRHVSVSALTESTNTDAKLGARAGAAHGSVWVADQQLAGRGRQGRSWISAAGEALLCSLLLRVTSRPQDLPRLALACGLAVCGVVARATGRKDIQVKWPNDVLCEGRKIAGILVESSIRGAHVEAVVIGIGLNVHTRQFAPEIAGVATSLARLRVEAQPALPLSRAELLVQLLEALEHDVPLALAKGLAPLQARLAAVDALQGQSVQRVVNAGAEATGSTSAHGIAEGIDADGRLLVRTRSGMLERWESGEVHLGR